MRKSARLLGRELGLSAAEMNALLADHGYLEGEPGRWTVTDKGRPYANEDDHFRGNPNSLAYSTSWSTRSWDEGILEALDEDRAASSRPSGGQEPAPGGDHPQDDGDLNDADAAASFDELGNYLPPTDTCPHHPYGCDDPHAHDDDPPPSWLALAVAAGIAAAGNPHVRAWMRDTAQPRAQQLGTRVQSRLRRRRQPDS
jgi:hypothetical protein